MANNTAGHLFVQAATLSWAVKWILLQISPVSVMSLYISLDDTDTDKQITAQRSSRTACTISLGLCLDPSGTCQSMRIPVKPKQSACAKGRSLRGCYTAREQTAAYWVSTYYLRTVIYKVHFHNVCKERQHEKDPLIRFGPKWQMYKAGRNKSRDLAKEM